MSGNATSAAQIGRPDLGLLTLTEMAQHARGIASAVDLPLLADADTGYGDAAMVARTVAEFEAAGVAGIHLEDQALPKRCGAMPGVRLAPLDEALERLRAALGARSDPEFVIVARTDALATDDYPEALRRARAFAEAGADLVFVEDPRGAEDVERLPRDLDGIPLMIDVFETWPWTQQPVQELEQLGYKLAIYCLSATLPGLGGHAAPVAPSPEWSQRLLSVAAGGHSSPGWVEFPPPRDQPGGSTSAGSRAMWRLVPADA